MGRSLLVIFGVLLQLVAGGHRLDSKTFVIKYQKGNTLIPVTVQVDMGRKMEYVVNMRTGTRERTVTLYDFNKRIIAYKDISTGHCFIGKMKEESLHRELKILENVRNEIITNVPSMTMYASNSSLSNGALHSLAGDNIKRFCHGMKAYLISLTAKERQKRQTRHYVRDSYEHYGKQSLNYHHYGHNRRSYGIPADEEGYKTQQDTGLRQYPGVARHFADQPSSIKPDMPIGPPKMPPLGIQSAQSTGYSLQEHPVSTQGGISSQFDFGNGRVIYPSLQNGLRQNGATGMRRGTYDYYGRNVNGGTSRNGFAIPRFYPELPSLSPPPPGRNGYVPTAASSSRNGLDADSLHLPPSDMTGTLSPPTEYWPPGTAQDRYRGASAASDTTVKSSKKATVANAASSGEFGPQHSQSQVQGTYDGKGSFSAQALSSFMGGSTQSQVSGGPYGGASGASANVEQLGSVQSQVQAGQPDGLANAAAQSTFRQGQTQVQAEGSRDSGSASSQAQSTGLSGSQAKVNLDGESSRTNGDFEGEVSASSRGGANSAQSNTNIQGAFSSGRRYSATAEGTYDTATMYSSADDSYVARRPSIPYGPQTHANGQKPSVYSPVFQTTQRPSSRFPPHPTPVYRMTDEKGTATLSPSVHPPSYYPSFAAPSEAPPQRSPYFPAPLAGQPRASTPVTTVSGISQYPSGNGLGILHQRQSMDRRSSVTSDTKRVNGEVSQGYVPRRFPPTQQFPLPPPVPQLVQPSSQYSGVAGIRQESGTPRYDTTHHPRIDITTQTPSRTLHYPSGIVPEPAFTQSRNGQTYPALVDEPSTSPGPVVPTCCRDKKPWQSRSRCCFSSGCCNGRRPGDVRPAVLEPPTTTDASVRSDQCDAVRTICFVIYRTVGQAKICKPELITIC